MLERTQELLGILVECQIKDDKHFGCAPISLKIGGVDSNNIVEHGVVYITECPKCVMDTLTALNYHMSITQQGLRIDCRF